VILAKTQECPRCRGAVNCEHTAIEDLHSHILTYLYCEFCGLGIETLWKHTPTCNEHVLTIHHSGSKDAIELGKFLQRLENARAA